MLRSNTTKNNTNWNEFTREIFRRLDIQAEAERLGVQFAGKENNGWQSCHAIDREDRNPSAAICIDSSDLNVGRYKDHGGTGESFSFWELAASLGHFSDWKEARDHYADQEGVALSDFTGNNQSQKTRHPMDQVEILEEFGDRYEEQLELWSKTKPPVTPEAIRDAGAIVVRWPAQAPEPFLCLGFSSCDDQQEQNGLILYRIDGESFPGYQGSQPKKTIITKGSSDGWGIIGGWERFKKASVVWKVEGIPDALALYAHLPEDHVVVTNICGAMAAGNCFPDLFQGKTVYAIGDADLPGQKGVEKFAQHIFETAESVRMIPLPFKVVEKHGKDVRDFFHEGHSFDELLNLAEKATPIQYNWPALVPICAPALPLFPVEVLPDDLRDWVLAESEATQTPPDLAALLALSVCAAALAKKVEVVGAYDWRESYDDWCPMYQHLKAWKSIYGDHLICGTCYPPVSEKVVAEWIERKEE